MNSFFGLILELLLKRVILNLFNILWFYHPVWVHSYHFLGSSDIVLDWWLAFVYCLIHLFHFFIFVYCFFILKSLFIFVIFIIKVNSVLIWLLILRLIFIDLFRPFRIQERSCLSIFIALSLHYLTNILIIYFLVPILQISFILLIWQILFLLKVIFIIFQLKSGLW